MAKLQGTLTRLFRVELEKQALPEELVIQSEQEEALWKSLNRLDDRHRVVLVLRYFHELSIREISEVLSVNEGTIPFQAAQRTGKTEGGPGTAG